MSAETVKTIISRAAEDSEFRGQLFREPDHALAGYDLTSEEITALKDLKPESFDAMGYDLEARISKSGLDIDPNFMRKLGAALE